MNFRSRLFILPILGLALFAGQSYRSIDSQWSVLRKEGGACFCWGGLPLDTKPLDKNYEMFGMRNLTACGALNALNAQTDLGCGESFFPTRLLGISALPAFLASLVIIDGLAKLGVSKFASFMVVTPVLIFVWYYLVSLLIIKLVRRRKLRPLASTH